MTPFTIFLISAVAVAALTPLLIVFAKRWGWLAAPEARSMHQSPVPSGGGMAIAVVVVAAMAWYSLPHGLIFGAALMAVVGFIDDVRPLPILPRLICQACAVGVAWFAIGGWTEWHYGGSVYVLSPAFQLIVAVACLWFLNLYNFMDGLDGLAGSELLFVALVAAVLSPSVELRSVWLALAGAAAGFLFWNRPPARIFMGDAGSGFIGLLIGLLLVWSVARREFSVWTALILVSPFVADASVTLLRRIVRGEPWYRPHVSHAYQHLARRWRSHGRVVLAFGAVNLFVVLPAAWLAESRPDSAPTVAVALLAVLSGVAFGAGAGAEGRVNHG